MESQKPSYQRDFEYSNHQYSGVNQIHHYDAPTTTFSYSRQPKVVQQKEVLVERLTSKLSKRPLSVYKGSDEGGKSFEDVELKSTVLSLHDRQFNVDYQAKQYWHSPPRRFEKPEIKRDHSEEVIVSQKDNETSEKGLLDQIFEKNYQEYSDYEPNLSY